MSIDLTTILASAVTATIIGGAQFISNRYLGRILDKIEQQIKADKNNGKDNSKPKTP